MSEPKHTNALIHETSPYLLQHAHNPVEWYPWGGEALRRSKEEDKPILLSIGYSACHWCHVMERESFENEEIAAIMNKHFINIKVDREERPDLDTIYMNAVQLMTGSGGWPMTVFLTPAQVPFYGGTYFPPADRHGLPGFPRLLLSIARAYAERKSEIQNDAPRIIGELERINRFDPAGDVPMADLLDNAVTNIMRNHDARYGGFGQSPKFPPSMTLTFLLRSYLRNGNNSLLEVVEQTLQKMANGGIYDQLGGGFHRYSVDQRWLVPHFEKMLYDNALLTRIFLDAYQTTRNNFYRQIAEETLDYVLREMTSPEGGFYSTQDADSEGEEGKFFVWTPRQVEAILGENEAAVFCSYYDITPEGNFESKSILNVPRPGSMVARLHNMEEDRFWEIIRRGRSLLFAEREKRVRPGRDEKILTAWNGLMLRSFAEAANVLDREDYRQVAIRNAEFILAKLRSEGRLLRTYRDGEAKLNAYLEDHAFLLDSLLSLYEATFDPRWIKESLNLADILLQQFWDAEGKGFYFTATDHESLICRSKDFYDNATPSGNSVAAHALLRLAKLTGEEKWSTPARELLKMMAAPMTRHSSAFANLLSVLDFSLAKTREIAVIGNPNAEETKSLLREIFYPYLPNKVVACGDGNSLYLLKDRPQLDGKPTVYVCENYVCKAPVTRPEELRPLLKN
jgi:hypothetical protein